MAEAAKKLAQAQAAAATGSIYTPSGTKAVVRHIRIVNMDTIDGWIQLWDGGTADANCILPKTFLAAAPAANDGGNYIELDVFVVLDDGVALNAKAHAASKVTVTLYGADGVA